MTKYNSVRSGLAFFLVTLSAAYLGAIGGRLTGFFGPPEPIRTDTQQFGIYLLIAVVILAVGAGIRRMDASEMRSAMLGAASILIAIPLSRVSLTNAPWDANAVTMATLGLLFLGAGMLVAFGLAGRMKPPPPED